MKFKKQQVLYFTLSLVVYFIPFIITASILLPSVQVEGGKKWAIGIALILINAFPFLKNIFSALFVKFPMINILSIFFLALATFFTAEYFRYYVEIFCWIEIAALVGSIFSCIFWNKYKKYKGFSNWNKGYEANKKVGLVK